MEERVWHQFYDDGVQASINFKEISLPGLLERSAAEYGDSPAVIFMNCRLTYQQLKEEVDRFATALVRLGVSTNTRVAIQLPNLPQAVIAYYATLSLGAQVVMTNPLYVEREITHQWTDAGCTFAVVTDFLFESRIKGIREKLPVKHYIIASIPEYLRFPLNLLAPIKLRKANPPLLATVAAEEGVHFMRKLIQATPPSPPKATVAMDSTALLQYTGGTTGVSKGAMLTHRNLSYNIQQVNTWFTDALLGQEVVLACLPFFHVFGMTISMNFAVSSGATMVLMPNPRDIPQIVKNIVKHRVTLFPAVPAIFNAINSFHGIDKIDLTSVTSCFSGSAPLPTDVLERFESLTGSKIVEGFGLTETSPVTHVNPLKGIRKVGSVGIPVPNTDAKIVDLQDGRTEVAVGTEGELIIKGPQVMKGYWNRPDETRAMIRDGWLYTGDIAVADQDGYFFIVGRKKDLIIVSGYNVYPDEVDGILVSHSSVLEAATIGLPDQKRGETVKSFVVLKPGQAATAEELMHYCGQELAAYKVPRQIEFRTDLPKSTVLKILRRELRKQEIAKSASKTTV